MAVQVLGARMHDDVGAERSGRVSTGVGTVESTASSAPAAWAMLAASAMSVTLHSGLAGVSIHTSLVRPGRIAAPIVAGSSASTKVASTPRLGRLVLQPLAQAPVHDLGRDHVRGPLERQDGDRRRRHARGHHQARRTAFEPGQHLLDLTHGRVVGPAVAVAAAILVVRIAQEGGRQMDRRHDRTRRLIDGAARLRGHGLRPHVFHRPTVLFPATRLQRVDRSAARSPLPARPTRGDTDARPGWWPRDRAARPGRCGRVRCGRVMAPNDTCRAAWRARRRQTIRAADQDGGCLHAVVTGLAQQPGERLARQHLAVLVERNR